MTEKIKKWKLHMGCHRGDIMSRDGGVDFCDSLEDCKKRVAEAESFWESIGYYVWFAKAIGPDGKHHELHPGTPYQR